jgi:hypothetical protein
MGLLMTGPGGSISLVHTGSVRPVPVMPRGSRVSEAPGINAGNRCRARTTTYPGTSDVPISRPKLPKSTALNSIGQAIGHPPAQTHSRDTTRPKTTDSELFIGNDKSLRVKGSEDASAQAEMSASAWRRGSLRILIPNHGRLGQPDRRGSEIAETRLGEVLETNGWRISGRCSTTGRSDYCDPPFVAGVKKSAPSCSAQSRIFGPKAITAERRLSDGHRRARAPW